jgi:hypothetical protein
MKKLMIVLIILANSLIAISQPTWSWAKHYGSTGLDQPYGACVDNAGNTYVLGFYSSTITIGPNTFNCSGDIDMFLAKLDTSGNVVWSQKMGGSGHDQGNAICTDNQGNLYLTGCFTSTVSFGTNVLTSYGGSDIFLARMDTAGNYIWVRKAGSTVNPTVSEEGIDLVLDGGNNILLSGGFEGTATFSPYTVASNGSVDAFVAKYDTNGNILWVRNGGSTSYHDAAHSVGCGPSKEVYISGFFEGTANFSGTSVISNGSRDIFIAKYDSLGTIQWVEHAGGTGTDEGTQMALDNLGNTYVTGSFYGTGVFDTINLVSASSSKDIFLAKYNSAGHALWAVKAGGTTDDATLYVATTNTAVYITGYISGTATFGLNQLISTGGGDAFVAKYDIAGNNEWVMAGSGTQNEAGFAVCVDPNYNIYMSGYSSGNTTFGIHPITNNGGPDIFVAKLNEQPCKGMPSVSINGLNSSYLLTDTPVALSGSPTGGVFYGTGIMGNTFSPYLAGIGTHTIVYIYLDGGCSKAVCESVDVTSAGSVQEHTVVDSDIRISPNPGDGIFNILISNIENKELGITIVNNIGQVVQSKNEPRTKGNYNGTIDLSKFPNGIYMLHIKIGSRNYSQKIVLMR